LIHKQHRAIRKQIIAGQSYRTVSASVSLKSDPTSVYVCRFDEDIFHRILMFEMMHGVGKRCITNIA
jgi:hypothetical protein